MALSKASTADCATSASTSTCSPISRRRARSSKNGGSTTTPTDRTRASTGSHRTSSQHAPHRGITGTDSPYKRGQLGEQVTVEHLDQLGKVHQGATQTVDLVDHHDVDTTCVDVGQQLFEGRALQCGAGDAAIVIAVAYQHPTFGFLACDVGLAGVALGIERVELLIQALFAGFAGVDGAAELSKHRFVHVRGRWFFKPKKTSPFQRVPVPEILPPPGAAG